MAIYHFSNQIKSRKKQQNAVAAAAYRSSEKLIDERTNEEKYYNRKIQPVTHILAPQHAPKWVHDRQRLWNEVERVEKQWNAQLCREMNIALPKELSHEEQEELTISFCQEVFAEDGMVADLSIHRDDEENPHFHVMLTMRPFNHDGTWGNKQSKIKEVVDGKETIKAVHTTDWNTKEKLLYWREQWAIYANRSLEKNGFSERISHQSHEKRGLETLPTIHEGFAARKMESEGKTSDRVEINKERKEYNRTVIDLKKAKAEKQRRERTQSFVRRFTPLEKKQLREAAKTLRIFVNSENIAKRKQQLKKWQSRLNFQPESIEKQQKLERIQNETVALETAENILEKEAGRFLKAYYPKLETGTFSNGQKIAIVDATLTENKSLNSEQINRFLKSVEKKEMEQEIDQLLNHRPIFVATLQKEVEELQLAFETLRSNENIDFSRMDSMKNAPATVLQRLQGILQQKEKSAQALTLMNRLYDSRIEDLYPEWGGRHYLTIEQKEWLVMAQEYYVEEIKPDVLVRPRRQYSNREQEDLLGRLCEAKTASYPVRKRIYEQLERDYPHFQTENTSYRMVFYQECQRNKGDLSHTAQSHFNVLIDTSLAVYGDREMQRANFTPSSNTSILSDFFQVLENVLREANQKWKEDIHEDLKRKKKKKKNRGMER